MDGEGHEKTGYREAALTQLVGPACPFAKDYTYRIHLWYACIQFWTCWAWSGMIRMSGFTTVSHDSVQRSQRSHLDDITLYTYSHVSSGVRPATSFLPATFSPDTTYTYKSPLAMNPVGGDEQRHDVIFDDRPRLGFVTSFLSSTSITF